MPRKKKSKRYWVRHRSGPEHIQKMRELAGGRPFWKIDSPRFAAMKEIVVSHGFLWKKSVPTRNATRWKAQFFVILAYHPKRGIAIDMKTINENKKAFLEAHCARLILINPKSLETLNWKRLMENLGVTDETGV